MINLKNEKLFDRHYIHDVDDLKKIQKALFMHRDLFVSLDEAALIWQTYSANIAASWLFLPDKLEDIPKEIESDNMFQGWENAL
jgi:1,2-phenylacetyl-CoA epoxidase PaaB subunit